MAPRTDRHRTRPIETPAPDADTTCGPRCATSMVARRLASPHRGRIYDCSRFDATRRRRGTPTKAPCRGRGGVRATVAGGASSRASAAPPLRCGPAGDPPPATVDGQLWPEARFRPGTDRHRPPPVPRRSRRCRLPPGRTDRFKWTTWRSPYTRFLSLRTYRGGPPGAGCNVARLRPPTVHHDGARCPRARCTRWPHVPEIAETELGSRSRLLAGPPRCRVRPAGGTGPMVHRAHDAPVRPDRAPRPDIALHHRRRHARSRPRARPAARDAKARTLDFSSKQRRRRRCTVYWGQPPPTTSGPCNVYWGQPPRTGDRPPSETVQRGTIAHPSGGRPRRRVSDPGSGVAHPVFFPAGRLDPTDQCNVAMHRRKQCHVA